MIATVMVALAAAAPVPADAHGVATQIAPNVYELACSGPCSSGTCSMTTWTVEGLDNFYCTCP